MDPDESGAPLYINRSFQGLYASLIWSLYWYLLTEPETIVPGSSLPNTIMNNKDALLQY